MSPIIITLITLTCTFGGALLANNFRDTLPASDATKETQDAVRLAMTLVSTMTALILGLVIANAKSAFDAQDTAIKTTAAKILALDRRLAGYGAETKPMREQLRQLIQARLEITWDHASPTRAAEATALAEGVETQILALAATSDTQRRSKELALDLAEEVLTARWRFLENESGADTTTFLPLLISWLTITFVSFGLFAPRNATVMTALFVASLSVSAAVYLLLEMDTPFRGAIVVSSSPLRYALTQLGQ